MTTRLEAEEEKKYNWAIHLLELGIFLKPCTVQNMTEMVRSHLYYGQLPY